MSQENVRTVHRFLRALDRRDYENARPCLCRDAEWHNTAAFPGSRTIVGPQAIVDFWQALVESFDPAEGGMEVENVTESGDLVVIGLRSRGHGATSGVPIDVRWGLRASMRDGKIERIDISGDYTSPRGRRAVGRMKVKSPGLLASSLAKSPLVRVTTS